MRLQTIRFPNKDICGEEEMYLHRQDGWLNFNGYFNLFYIEKRKKYCRLDGVKLYLQIQGASSIRLMHDQEVIRQIELSLSDRVCEIEFPYQAYESGVFWFAVQPRQWDPLELSGYFEGIGKPSREINIGAVICTYKREGYVYRNLQSLKELFEQSDVQAGNHLKIFVIDNGQSLQRYQPIQSLAEKYKEKILIFGNCNAGGAGGFTRGMMEALKRRKQEGLTHVLLMDDDAVFEPDLFVRLYGFLSFLKEEWQDLTVGGNLMREDFPYLQHAGGEWFGGFKVHNDHILMDLRSFEACRADCLCQTDYRPGTYSGWWCCCFSLNTVREDNLPIPLFLHYDDVEFGLRSQGKGIVFLNGIGAWHKGFEYAFAGSTRYYDVRNTLITTALHQPRQKKIAVKKWVWRNIIGALLEYRYGEARLAYQGLVDFCKGPDWLISQNPERLNQKIRGKFSLNSLEELKKQVSPREYEEILRQIRSSRMQIDAEQIRNFYSPSRRKGHFLHKALWNGWFLPAKKGPLIAVSAMDTPYKAFRCKRILLFEPFSEKVLLAQRDYGEFKKILKCLIKTSMLVDRFYQKAACEYRERLSEITSMSAWERYLGLDEDE